MGFPARVISVDGSELRDPYLMRIAGWTEDRYFKEAPETHFVEFEDGEIIVHSPVNTRHQRIVRFLTVLLSGYIETRNLGEVLNGPAVVRLRPGLDLEPDIFFVPRDQLDRLGEEYFSGVPGLIVEVISPGSRNYDLRHKASTYREYRVPEYWAVDPERTVLVRHCLADDPPAPYEVREYSGGRVECRAVPGFWLEVSWLWQAPPPEALRCLAEIQS